MPRVPDLRGPIGQKAAKPVNGTRGGLLHMRSVKELPCCICKAPPPSEAHHCRSDGMARDDYKTIPLCPACHRIGPLSYHGGGRKAWKQRNGPDYGFLDMVEKQLDARVYRS